MLVILERAGREVDFRGGDGKATTKESFTSLSTLYSSRRSTMRSRPADARRSATELAKLQRDLLILLTGGDKL